ncbi:MAG TPA: GNAT family N-acetyltransferase [Clostridiales bacterium]|nr:GNAT family N-acetyltransferase [Clostridiales bacterium]
MITNIATERCVLSPISESDFGEIIPLFTNNEVRRYLGGPLSVEWAFNRLNESLLLNNDIRFVVRRRETEKCIGLVFITPHHNPADSEISYMFMPEYWGKGYAFEVVKRLLEFCRDELKLARVVSETQTANVRSCHLLEKLGYMLESKVERFGAEQSIYAKDL